MRTAILSTTQAINTWIDHLYPEIIQYQKTCPELLAADNILLLSFYEADKQIFQLFDLWHTYLQLGSSRKKLILLGWVPFPSLNYIQIYPGLTGLDKKIQQAEPIGRDPKYPDLPFLDMKVLFSRFLQSHGKRALQKLLIQISKPLWKVEELARQREPLASIQKSTYWQEASLLMEQIMGAWKDRLPYYAFFPKYLQLKKIESFFQTWQKWQMEGPPQSESESLADEVQQYLEDVIRDIMLTYHIEDV
ncbi:MAG: hypothetical protein AAF388_02045 [Bacteroidota bacterium]